MTVNYWKGGAVGLAMCGLGIVIAGQVRSHVGRSGSPDDIGFEPAFVGLANSWILPNDSLDFEVELQNRSRDDAWIEDLRFSCPCASGTIAGGTRFPVCIPAGTAVPVVVKVASKHGERGHMELQFGVVGRVGERPLSSGAVAEVKFVQALNADPPVLSLGEMERKGTPFSTQVQIWAPSELDVPEELEVTSDDPAVIALLSAAPRPRQPRPAGTPSAVGTLTIITDPRIAPDRMHATVTVHAGDQSLEIPVFGVARGSLP